MSDIAVSVVMGRDAEKMLEETNVDTGKVEMKCQNCSSSESAMRDVIKTNAKLNEYIKGLEIDKINASRRFEELKERSNLLTEFMSEVMENKSNMENVNDEFCNSKLGKKFEKLYSNEWTDLSDWLDENVEITEQKRMRGLSKLLQRSYDECVKLAEEQIRVFLFLGDSDETPDVKEKPTLYKERRQHGQEEHVRQQIQERVINTMEESIRKFGGKQEENILSDIQKKIKSFLHKYIDLCWLLIISHPRLYLVFDVVDQPYHDIKERFCKYSSQDRVKHESKVKDSVYCVVWPCVVLEDASGIIVKGSVMTVDIGKEESNQNND